MQRKCRSVGALGSGQRAVSLLWESQIDWWHSTSKPLQTGLTPFPAGPNKATGPDPLSSASLLHFLH